ncbi:hypothetical protein NDU88_012622 [Pleurodeles waltl]|uniref:Uncharacterized protein n=1 Tax=Pleurodeles waltl TaxID=8319 RepID=A0AAV7R6M7_PLEWA|nr:hypothetical protein NDU88_012622 [Pleurodeles waltl]
MEAQGWFYGMATLAWCTRYHWHGGAGLVLRLCNSCLVHAVSSAWRRRAGSTAWITLFVIAALVDGLLIMLL